MSCLANKADKKYVELDKCWQVIIESKWQNIKFLKFILNDIFGLNQQRYISENCF